MSECTFYITLCNALKTEISPNFLVRNFFGKAQCQRQPPKVFFKKDVLKNFSEFAGKYLCQSIKETLAQMFYCEFWELFKSTFFTEQLRTTVSTVRELNALCVSAKIPNQKIKWNFSILLGDRYKKMIK